jgi:hypothetical protein
MVALGALAGGLLVFLFDCGRQERSTLVDSPCPGRGSLIIPPFRRIWWWIPVSLLIQMPGWHWE